MLTIINNNTNPRFNLALEEYVLKYLNIDEDFLLIWQNSKSVIIGRNQNPFLEINGYFVNKNKIPVIRRTTLGSAIYHDMGNINYAFVTKNSLEKEGNYKIFLDPVVTVLNGMGYNANIRNKKNLFIGKDKISIDYQNTYQGKIIHHGLIFIDSNLNYMKHIFNNKIIGITNLKKHFKQEMTVSMFRVMFLHELLEGKVRNKVYKLDKLGLKRINQLIENKYNSWDWNYGESGSFLITKEYDNRMLITVIVDRGYIKDITIESFENTIKLEESLLNIKFHEAAFREALKPFTFIDTAKFIDTIMY
ncbi:MAG: hypothetical protein KAH16_05050 [Candidatus Izimaplasma sp.]|nr:hypothetical protein [Candidatus Izimaplasma bacterium]